METVYTIAFWVGLIIPSLSLIFSGLCHAIDCSLDLLDGSGFDGGTDVGFHGIFGNILAFFPTSPLSIMAFLLVFGGVGKLCVGHFSWHWVPAVFCGVLGAYLVEFGILRPLRRVRCETIDGESFIGKWGIITQAIMENGYGVVSFQTKVGRSTFIAMADEPIAQGEEVEVIRCERGRLYVKPAHPFRVNEQKMKGEEHA